VVGFTLLTSVVAESDRVSHALYAVSVLTPGDTVC
jgi:hypothetical protein